MQAFSRRGFATVEDEAQLRQDLRAYLKAYNDALTSGKPEAERDAWIGRLDALVPQANISDLYFWGECERTDEEVVDEAVRRQKIWRSGGELALLLHLEAQLRTAASNPDLRPVYRNYVNGQLPRVQKRIEGLAGGSRH